MHVRAVVSTKTSLLHSGPHHNHHNHHSTLALVHSSKLACVRVDDQTPRCRARRSHRLRRCGWPRTVSRLSVLLPHGFRLELSIVCTKLCLLDFMLKRLLTCLLLRRALFGPLLSRWCGLARCRWPASWLFSIFCTLSGLGSGYCADSSAFAHDGLDCTRREHLVSAPEVGFVGDRAQSRKIRSELAPLRMTSGPAQHFQSAIFEVGQLEISARLSEREGFRGCELLDLRGSHQLLVSLNPR